MAKPLVFHISDYANPRKETPMGLMKRAATAKLFDRSFKFYSSEERAALRILTLKPKDAEALAQQVFRRNPPKESGPYALLLLYAEGSAPKTADCNYLVIDKTTGCRYFVFYDGETILHNSSRLTLAKFNNDSYHWFRIPEFRQGDLDELA